MSKPTFGNSLCVDDCVPPSMRIATEQPGGSSALARLEAFVGEWREEVSVTGCRPGAGPAASTPRRRHNAWWPSAALHAHQCHARRARARTPPP